MRRTVASLVAAATVASAPLVTAATAAGPKPPAGFWIAGDLHVHTIYGHDTCITPTTAWDPSTPDRAARRSCADPYTVGFTPAQRLQEATDRGLGFVALTDHNNVVNQSDPDALAFEAANPALVVVPGYENSQPGHVQMLGARSCYGNAGATAGVVECDQAVTDQSATGQTALANALRADGGVFQVNHPSDMNWLSRYGYDVVPDTVEVWNIGPWAYQHPLPASNDNDFSLRWYDGFLERGLHVGVTGGSDSHWVSTDAIQGVGEPTTWVFARTRSVQGILDGLRAHHTFVSALPPAAGGTQLFLEADRKGDGSYDAIAGSTVSPHVAMRVRAVGAAPGSVLRLVTDTGAVEIPLTSSTYNFRPGQDGVPAAAKFVRAELLAPDGKDARRAGCDPVIGAETTACRDDLAMQALTSPLFLGSEQQGG